MHNGHNWIYTHLEGIMGSTTAAVYGFVTFQQGMDEAVFRVIISLLCGFVGAAGAWIFKKIIDKNK